MTTVVKEIMKAPVVTTVEEANISYIRELMERKSVNAIPIVHIHNDKVDIRGIITSSDIRGITDETLPVSDYMTNPVLTVTEETTLKTAGELMLKNNCHHLLVMDKNRITGIISSMDYVKMATR